MNKFVRCLLFVLTLLAVVPGFATTYVAVMGTRDKSYVLEDGVTAILTDKLRERAMNMLPTYSGFAIMTEDQIRVMLPPDKDIAECINEECLVETGRNVSADYVAQADVVKIGNRLSISARMFDTKNGNLVGTFMGVAGDAMGLLDEIEKKADGMFSAIAGGNMGMNAGGGADGFEGVNMGGSGYKASGSKSYIVSVNSNPAGAVFSVDGRPDADCSKTPCDITLSAGNHRFSFGLKMYFDKDTVFVAKQSGQKLAVKLNPNFGELTLKPQLQSGVGSADGLNFEIDGNKVTGEKFRLAPGRHSVAISHSCYETASFNVNINNGSDLVFDKPLVAKTGGLKLDVVENGKPKAVPVFVNGNRMGVTPFLETIPVCSKITVGDDREPVPVKLKANETVTYKHELGGGSTFTDSRDGQRYKTVKIGNQVWMAENLNYKTNDSYCYKNDEGMCKKYGRLYTWYAAKNACPSGWHLPNDNEWNTLWNAVGGTNTAGRSLKLKSAWYNRNGSDSFGFAVLPAGLRYGYGDFDNEGSSAYFWSSTEFSSDGAYNWGFSYDHGRVYRSNCSKFRDISVRCLRN